MFSSNIAVELMFATKRGGRSAVPGVYVVHSMFCICIVLIHARGARIIWHAYRGTSVKSGACCDVNYILLGLFNHSDTLHRTKRTQHPTMANPWLSLRVFNLYEVRTYVARYQATYMDTRSGSGSFQANMHALISNTETTTKCARIAHA